MALPPARRRLLPCLDQRGPRLRGSRGAVREGPKAVQQASRGGSREAGGPGREGERGGLRATPAPRVTFRRALIEVAAVERRAGPEVLQVLGGRLGRLWEVGLQGPAGRKAGQSRAAGRRALQVRPCSGGPLGAWRLVPRGRIGVGPRPHAEGRAALGVHAGSGRTGRRGSGARAARAACERPPRGRDLGAGARSPRERRAPRGGGGQGRGQRLPWNHPRHVRPRAG